MISKYRHKDLNWVDLKSPTQEEVAYILEEYTIPLFIKEEIAQGSKEDVVRLDHGYIFAYLNLPQVRPDEYNNNKLIFIANDNFVIVIHDEPIQALSEFSKEMELDTITEEKFGTNNNKLLLAYMLRGLYVNSQKELDQDESKITILEKQILNKSKKVKFLTILSFILLGVIILLIWL